MFPSEIRLLTTQQDVQEQTANDTQTLFTDFTEISRFDKTLTENKRLALQKDCHGIINKKSEREGEL